MTSQLGAWLRQQRLARGWAMAEMARQLVKAARANGDTQLPGTAVLASYIRRWERGLFSPTERYRLLYAAAFDIPADQVGPARPGPDSALTPHGSGAVMPDASPFGVGPAALGCRPAAVPPGRAGPAGGYREDRKVAVGEGAADQRGAGPPPDELIAAIAQESLDFGEWADTSNIGDATLEQYAALVRRLASDYQRTPPYPLLLETRRLRDRVFAKVQGHQRPGQTRELYLIAAQVCGLLAWMSGDMSCYRAADAHAWTAWVCAEQADYDGARTWVRATQSKLAFWDGRFVESAQLAENGLTYHSPDSGRVMLTLFHARALARLGRGQEAATALGRARTAQEQAGPDEIGGLWSVVPARFHSLASSTQVWRRDAAEALVEADQAVALFEAGDLRERDQGAAMNARIDQAQAHLLRHDLDGADTALRPVLVLAPESRYDTLNQHIGQVRQALAEPEFRASVLAERLQEEIETYCRESIINDLRG